MKHIRKKFLFEDSIKNINLEEQFEYIKHSELTKEKIKKFSKGHNIIIETNLGEKLFAFIHNNNGQEAFIPLPDLTLVYYNTAYSLNKTREEQEQEMLKILSNLERFSESNASLIYNFYGLSSSCIINLFTTLESFMNSLLPTKGNYERITKKSTEIFNFEQIQIHISFDEKIKKVIPFFHSKDFFKKQSSATQHIENLKQLRDKIIHTKADHTGQEAIDIFKKILSFKYTETFTSIRTYMNYYKANYIEECNCGEDF